PFGPGIGSPQRDGPGGRNMTGRHGLTRFGLGGDSLAQPGEGERVAVVDAGMRSFEKLESDDLIANSGRGKGGAGCFSSDGEVEVISRARVDPDRSQGPQRVGVRRNHPHRVPVQPALPYLVADYTGARVEGQLGGAIARG